MQRRTDCWINIVLRGPHGRTKTSNDEKPGVDYVLVMFQCNFFDFDTILMKYDDVDIDTVFSK